MKRGQSRSDTEHVLLQCSCISDFNILYLSNPPAQSSELWEQSVHFKMNSTLRILLRFFCYCSQAQLIAQSIGQAFSVAYQEFLRANGINPEDLSQKEYSDIINTQEMYNDDLIHFSNSENCKEVCWNRCLFVTCPYTVQLYSTIQLTVHTYRSNTVQWGSCTTKLSSTAYNSLHQNGQMEMCQYEMS